MAQSIHRFGSEPPRLRLLYHGQIIRILTLVLYIHGEVYFQRVDELCTLLVCF